ncbi:terminase small subunit [Neiella sp. HB171785]|uniref:Terminase small subunit n=1 Tax=Neiella litorisoli TaxID=2771431 RepID=A0A8J6UDU6_9GAMM|nr:terminase small subunit [Neiella litorisoli]MBD1388559.1 terminase small subunit [Neiella litorisoli]
MIANRKEMAEIIGVTPSTIDTFVEKGAPCIEKGKRGVQSQYDTASFVRWYIEYKRDQLLNQGHL